MFAVTVTFRPKPGPAASFLPLKHDNACASPGAEPGCRQFDPCSGRARPERVVLREIRDNASASRAQVKTTRFGTFDAAVSDMSAEQSVFTFSPVVQ